MSYSEFSHLSVHVFSGKPILTIATRVMYMYILLFSHPHFYLIISHRHIIIVLSLCSFPSSLFLFFTWFLSSRDTEQCGVPRLSPREIPSVSSMAAFLMKSNISPCDDTQFHLQTDRKGQVSMVALRCSALRTHC